VSDASTRPTDGAGEGSRPDPETLVVGHVTRAHGTKGEVFVWPLTDRPAEVFARGTVLIAGDEEGGPGDAEETVTVEGSRAFKRGILLKLAGVDDRNTAEVFARRYLLVARVSLSPLAEDEVYYHQLLGLEVVTSEGEAVGRVREVFETEPAYLLEVRGPEKVHLIPFTERVIRKVDVEAGRVVIKPPPGLLEL
jgi:16S rRNA processing protein RimM